MPYLSERRRRELALPVSIVRRCFIRMVIGSAWDGEGAAPSFDSVAGESDISIHDALLSAELAPFDGLDEKTRARLHKRVLLDRETICKPYEKGMLLAGFMSAIGIVSRLTQEDRLILSADCELSMVLDSLMAHVQAICPREWESLETGTFNQAGRMIETMARLGYRYDAMGEMAHAA